MVQELQFNFDASRRCEVHNCTNDVFIRCTHCGNHLCLRHFLQRVCSHEEDDGPQPGTSSDTSIVGRFVPRLPVPEYDAWEREFYTRIAHLRDQNTTTTVRPFVIDLTTTGEYHYRDELRA